MGAPVWIAFVRVSGLRGARPPLPAIPEGFPDAAYAYASVACPALPEAAGRVAAALDRGGVAFEDAEYLIKASPTNTPTLPDAHRDEVLANAARAAEAGGQVVFGPWLGFPDDARKH